MMYLTYNEYQNMGGTLDETTFNDLEFHARAQIDWYTFNRLQQEEVLPEAVKRCVYHIVSLVFLQMSAATAGSTPLQESAVSAGIASQSNDGVSISYNILSASEAIQVSKDQIQSAINTYLQGVMNSLGQKVLYRGVYPNE